MSIDSHLIHRCTIQRYLPVGDDSLKAPKKDWRPWIEGLRCRRVTKQQRVGDVQQGDRVVNVIDETGTTEVGTFKIESVIIRRGRAARHVSLILERVP
jgi:hypothetical protein